MTVLLIWRDITDIWIGQPVFHPVVDASSVLFQAASTGNLDQARWAVEHCGVSPNDVDNQGQHALHIAAQNNVLPMLRYLVRVGSNIDVQSKVLLCPQCETCVNVKYVFYWLFFRLVKHLCMSVVVRDISISPNCYS